MASQLLTRKMYDDGTMQWTLIGRAWSSGRVSLATYVATPPLFNGNHSRVNWSLSIYRNFRMKHHTAFPSRLQLVTFVTKRIYEGSGHHFDLKPEDLIREGRW